MSFLASESAQSAPLRDNTLVEQHNAPAVAGHEPPTPRIQPAQPSQIARSVRRFGDEYPLVIAQWPIRGAGLILMVATIFYIPWMLTSLNGAAPWSSWPFAAASLFTAIYSVVAVSNLWDRRVPVKRPVERGAEQAVAVIIPTCGEPIPMILRTVISVFEQDYPSELLTVIVSDDGHDADLRRELEALDLGIIYVEPVDRWAPGRDGAAKAGNLNCAVEMLDSRFPDIVYIETRDADDEVGSLAFVRETIGQLEADPGLGFVQTIKETQVSAGDPFNNRESVFYRGQMVARNSVNAVFPCGSGLMWRRSALRDIGGFPTWNLVEDLHSGVEALRRGWRGQYLPIVGAVGQHSPEDVPNVYKQRGTWAIDTVRLMVWGNLRGMNIRQRVQFYGLALYYVNSFAVMIYLPCLLFSLLGWPPLDASGTSLLMHLVPIMAATELWLLVANHPYNDRRTKQRRPYLALWRARIIWTGLAPVFAKATILAIVNGPNHKPTYKVTRKHNDLRWHAVETVPQMLPLVAVAAVTIFALVEHTTPSPVLMLATLYWGALNVALLAGFVTRGWHGLERLARVVPASMAIEAKTSPDDALGDPNAHRRSPTRAEDAGRQDTN